MKVAICSSAVPFVQGGYRNIADWLDVTLREHGHEVETIYLPQRDDPETLMMQMASFRMIDLSSADRLICLRPQAHLIPHAHKMVWFIHHLRLLYDLWDSDYRDFPASPANLGIRDAVRSADTAALAEARGLFANSQVTANRLKKFNGLDAEVLYPPLLEPDTFHCLKYGDEIVSICRIEPHKRQHLLIEALAHSRSKVRVRICGLSSSEAYLKRLKRLVARLKLRDRVTIDHRWISEAEKHTILGECLGVFYAPVDEDSYGYPSLEAAHAQKPIITTNDAGGVLELVTDGENGLVCEPEPKALAEALDRLSQGPKLAKKLGERAKEAPVRLGISWHRVVERLLA